MKRYFSTWGRKSFRFSVVSFEFQEEEKSLRRGHPDRVGVNAERAVRREEKGEEGFLTARPDAPEFGATEKIGPLRSK
jgi:hypothetical protein